MQGSLMLDIAGTWLTAEDRQILRQPQVAGLILFARNIEDPRQVRELSAAIRAVRPDLLLAVDQEGGRVQRLRQGFVRLPAMRALADNPNAEHLAEQCGWVMATEVLAAGLDLSFAPVLDLDHQRSAVVGSRSFEGDAQRATLLAGAFIRGMNAAGMAATGKHFPGHGWAEADSHVAIPVDERSLEQIRAADLQPFALLSQQLLTHQWQNATATPAGAKNCVGCFAHSITPKMIAIHAYQPRLIDLHQYRMNLRTLNRPQSPLHGAIWLATSLFA